MTKYLFVYHAPFQPSDAKPADPAEMEGVMGQWMAWAGRVGEGMVDFGTPLALAEGHPHLNMPGGCTVEVHEAQPIPGM